MNKAYKVIYWIATILFSALMLFSANMYFTQTKMVEGMMTKFGYPTYIVIPLAVCKILGVLTILSNFNTKLKEWAYAAFFFEVILAFFAHYMVNEEAMIAVVAMILLLISYFTSSKARKSQINA
jgi:hypothetical protein